LSSTEEPDSENRAPGTEAPPNPQEAAAPSAAPENARSQRPDGTRGDREGSGERERPRQAGARQEADSTGAAAPQPGRTPERVSPGEPRVGGPGGHASGVARRGNASGGGTGSPRAAEAQPPESPSEGDAQPGEGPPTPRPARPGGSSSDEPGRPRGARPLWRRAVAPAVPVVLALVLRVTFTYQIHTSKLPGLTRADDVIAGPGATPVQARDDGTDMEKHDYIARWVLAHGWYEKSADVSPLYPYVALPALYWLTGSDIFASKIVQALFDSATVLLIFLLAARLYDRRSAVYAGLGAAVYAPFIVYQGQLMSEWLLNLLLAALFLVLLGVSERMSWKRAAAAGVLFGLAAAAKPTALVLAPLALVWIWRRAGWGWRAALGPSAVAAGAALLVLLPFGWRNYHATGQAYLIRGNSGIMLYMGNNPSATGAYKQPSGEAASELAERTASMPLCEKDRVYRDAALSWISRNPGDWLRLMWRKFKLYFSAPEVPNNLSVRLFRQTTMLGSWVYVGFGVVLPLCVAGFAFSMRRRGVWLVCAEAAVYSGAVITFVVVGRYRLAILPLLFPAAGFAASRVVGNFTDGRLKAAGKFAAVALAAAVAVNYSWLYLEAAQLTHPNGFRRDVDGGVRIRDDSNYATPFGAWLFGSSGWIVKYLELGRLGPRWAGATVGVRCRVKEPGELRIRLNETTRTVLVGPGGRRWVKVDFPAEALVEGRNAIYLSGDNRLRLKVYADEAYNFHRSAYSPDGESYITAPLDHTTYIRAPSLPMGGSEFKIRLELGRSVAEPQPKSGAPRGEPRPGRNATREEPQPDGGAPGENRPPGGDVPREEPARPVDESPGFFT